MSKGKKKKFGKRIPIIIGIFVIAAVAGGVYLYWQAKAAQAAFMQEAPLLTTRLEKSDITKTLSVSGVVESGDITRVYTTQSYPVQEVFVKVGDTVKTGDILAVLDMSKLTTDITQSEINYKDAVVAAADEIISNQNSVTTAEITLESDQLTLAKQRLNVTNAEKELQKAKEKHADPFDSYSYDVSIEDAAVNLERKLADLAQAELDYEEALNDFDSYSYENTIHEAGITLERKKSDLAKAEKDLEDALQDFDDYAYQNAIKEANINLDRKLEALAEAEANLETEKNATTKAFDDFTYKNAITEANRNHTRKKEDLEAAEKALEDAYNSYYNAVYWASVNTAYQSQVDTAWAGVEKAQSTVDAANRALEDASASVKKANNELDRAKANYNDNNKETKDNAIEAAQKSVDNAQSAVDDAQRSHNKALSDLDRAKRDAGTTSTDAVERAQLAVSDAQRSYDKAVADLDRAKRDAASNTFDKLESAQSAVSDAQRSYDKAVSDRTRAEEKAIEDTKTALENAQKAYDDSKNQLATTEINLKKTENTLEQTKNKQPSKGSTVTIQEMNLNKLYEQLEEGTIVALADGVITEVNATVGATASGILFVIEDLNHLYVSAKVKEYNVSAVKEGQAAFVTTEATGDAIYDGTVSYISPKAVSAAGSTSVEFEVWADVNQPDTAIKVGMNAFLNITTDFKSDVYAVPLAAVVSTGRGSFVYTMENGERKAIPVTVGIKNSTHAEISGEDLVDGLEILIDPEGTITSVMGGFPSGATMQTGGPGVMTIRGGR